MKTKTCIFAILLAVGLSNSYAQDTWTQKANFPGGYGRYGAVGFSIGGKGYMGTGYDFYLGHQRDLWEYDRRPCSVRPVTGEPTMEDRFTYGTSG